ncbi:putative protein without homology [Propionibacterium freudenreichii subsp. shermanii]|nr:putative protein without homology [Propionibacterium freudenreichii subsp. shermanii]
MDTALEQLTRSNDGHGRSFHGYRHRRTDAPDARSPWHPDGSGTAPRRTTPAMRDRLRACEVSPRTRTAPTSLWVRRQSHQTATRMHTVAPPAGSYPQFPRHRYFHGAATTVQAWTTHLPTAAQPITAPSTSSLPSTMRDGTVRGGIVTPLAAAAPPPAPWSRPGPYGSPGCDAVPARATRSGPPGLRCAPCSSAC